MARPAHADPPKHRLRYLALAGPTASGKTAAALAIAREHAVEIVSVDSALVYRGMDIGTAKPSPAEQAAVPHHLIDIRDPLQPFSAAEFASQARALIAQISARGRLPLLVGGTMLYFKALREGLHDMPPAHPQVRAEIEAQASVLGWPAMHAQLAEVDPVSAARLHPADSQRIQRALEVFKVSGRPLSAFHASESIAREQGSSRVGGQKSAEETEFEAHMISLEPQDRAWLHQRIAERFDAMLAAGFLDEVQGLRARGDLHAELPAMRCVGYRQAWEALEGHWPMAELRERGIAATRQLAKRQITWLRSSPQREVVHCDTPDAAAQALQRACAFIERSPQP
jgi:tRNA dimethylallyltransferase